MNRSFFVWTCYFRWWAFEGRQKNSVWPSCVNSSVPSSIRSWILFLNVQQLLVSCPGVLEWYAYLAFRLYLGEAVLGFWGGSFNVTVVPQNFPSHFIKISPHKTLWTQDQARVCSAQDISLHCWPKIRVWVCTSIFGLSMLNVTFMLHVEPIRLLIPSFKPWIKFLPSQLDSWPKNQLYWGKSQLWPIYSQISWILTHINIMNSYEPCDQVWITIPQEIWSDHQKGKMVIFRVLTVKRAIFNF